MHLLAQRSETGAEFGTEKFRLLPGCIVPTLVDPVVIDELVICPLGPASRRFIVLAGKDAHRRRDGNVGCRD